MNLKFHITLIIILHLIPKSIVSQKTYLSETDTKLFNDYAAYIAPYETEPMETVLEYTARFFLGIPYAGSTLDQKEDETLVINLSEMDCVTYVENVLALSLAVREHNLSQTSLVNNVKKIRYRNNEIVDFSSRIHYTSDWIVENEENKLIKNISKELSGVKETKKINFMSTHRSSYNQIANNDSLYLKIVKMEEEVNARGGFYYLPKKLITAKSDEIPHMSVVAFITAIPGLDTSHVGFAFHKNGKLTFIHASSLKQKVVINDKTLSEYCLSQKNCKGIIVVKVN